MDTSENLFESGNTLCKDLNGVMVTSTTDLNHVCRAFIEHTGMYACCQVDQTRFLPQGDVSELYHVYASYMFL